MVGEFYSCDNSGNRTGPHPDISDPVAGTAIDIVCPVQNEDYSVTGLIGGEMYAITCLVGPHIFGIAAIGVPASADPADVGDGNAIWACGEGHTIVIRMPIDKTTLICQTPDTTAFHRCVLRRLAK